MRERPMLNWREKMEGKDGRWEADYLTEKRADGGDEIWRESEGKNG